MLPPQALAAASMTCKHWMRICKVRQCELTTTSCQLIGVRLLHVRASTDQRDALQHDELWKRHCDGAFCQFSHDATRSLLRTAYGCVIPAMAPRATPASHAEHVRRACAECASAAWQREGIDAGTAGSECIWSVHSSGQMAYTPPVTRISGWEQCTGMSETQCTSLCTTGASPPQQPRVTVHTLSLHLTTQTGTD
jgi:hypothetical protein